MELKVIRQEHSALSTIGTLYIDCKPFCRTLEDIERAKGVKVKKFTAIPKGEYFVKLSYSDAFKRLMPLIYNNNSGNIYTDGVSFDGVRIHGGNTHLNTDGCILIAKEVLKTNTIIKTDKKTVTVKDYLIFDSMEKELVLLMQEGEIYNLIIE